QIALGVSEVCHPLTPRHIRCFSQDRDPLLAQALDGAVDVLDVDEQLVAWAGLGFDTGEHPRGLLGGDGKLGGVSTKPDVPGAPVRGREAKELLETKLEIERGDSRD